MSINHVTVSGNLTRDPEVRTTASGKPVMSFEQIGDGHDDADPKWLTGVLQKFYRSHESLEILLDRVMEEEGGCIALWEFEPIDSYIE